ncbi:MAG: imidazole glycerol phosphate synthase subunit HisH [Syntrophorhabdaceae bacterium]
MIAIINYGLGNVNAFAEVYKKLNVPAMIVNDPQDLEKADKIILPGVGSFDQAITLLERSGMKQGIEKAVRGSGVAVLGVCVGMQILADASEEGILPGFGWIRGKVKKFNAGFSCARAYVPHMGWNNIKPLNASELLKGLDEASRFYFLHSYYFECEKSENIIAITEYCGQFTCAVHSGNIYGVQFHPEKSHQWGVRLLQNFAEI